MYSGRLEKLAPPIFLPIFHKEDRQRLAEIAIGTSLDESCYEGLHDRITVPLPNLNEDREIMPEITNEQNDSHDNDDYDFEIDDNKKQDDKHLAAAALDSAYYFLKNKLQNSETAFLTGIVKFNERLTKLSPGQLNSALHLFGSSINVVKSRKTTKAWKPSNVKRAQKLKIGVQPEAIKRRIKKNGTKSCLKKGRSSKLESNDIPTKNPSLKRKHKFARNVENDEPVAKKAGRNMGSKTKKFVVREKKQLKKEN